MDEQDQSGGNSQNGQSNSQSNQGKQQPVAGLVAPPPALDSPPVLDPPPVIEPPPPLINPLPPPEVPPVPPEVPPIVEALPWIAFLAVLFTPTSTAPPWMDELNPITGGPYKSKEEYESIRRLSPEEIRKRAAEYRRQQLARAQSDTQTTTCGTPVGGSTVPCPPPVATAASSKPTPGAIPSAVVMPSGLSAADQKLWSECKSLHDDYKKTQDATKGLYRRINPIQDDLANNRSTTPQQRLDFCNLVRQLIDLLARLHKERKKYIDNGCDKFDWFNLGQTEAKRRKRHLDELDNVDLQIKNLWTAHGTYCK